MRIAERAARVPRALVVELFAVANLAFLTLDVFIAHSINAFHYPIERIPVVFGATGAAVLLSGLAVDAFDPGGRAAARAGRLVGWTSILVGVAGLLLHLRSTFFEVRTLASLVYTAPFAAPLSFAGLGFLVLLNRQVARDSVEWGRWVLFLAWAGFVGNLALSLADHAQNGFFDAREWIPVIAAALAVGFLGMAVLRPADVVLRRVCRRVMAGQALVGATGFALHVAADLEGRASWTQDVLFGAPPFAPLLFADLALLAAVALADLDAKLQEAPAGDAGERPGLRRRGDSA